MWSPPLVAFGISFFASMVGISGAFLLLPFQRSILHYTAPGIVDEEQLESTLARAPNQVAYGNPGPDIAELAAACGFGFARNHPFTDGNKRVALAAIDVFLQMNGFELIVEEPEAVVVVQDLAAGRIEEAEPTAWIRGHILELRDE